MILAAVTVRCPSNGRRASSTSGVLAPAAQSSAGRAPCSCLPWPAVLPRRPHRPLLLSPLARPSLYSPHPLLFCGDGSLTPQRTSEPSYSSTCTWASTAASSPAPRCPLPRPRHRPPPWCSRCGMVNMVNERLPSDVVYMERLKAGSMAAARKCLLITRK